MEDCAVCRKNGEDGDICPIQDTDGFQLRCMGFWAKVKLSVLFRYIDMFTISQHNKWSNLAYIDMFAGPGKGIIRDKKEIVIGSPLNAFQQKHLFTHYVFIDSNAKNITALESRISQIKKSANVKYIPSDCNTTFLDIAGFVPEDALVLIFIDPTSMQINFSTICDLANHFEHLDMIINFPRQSIVRQFKHALNNMGNESNFNRYFGENADWKNCLSKGRSLSPGGELLNLYKDQLSTLRFNAINDTRDSVLVRGPKNIPLYELIFASRHKLAYKLFHESINIRGFGQGRLPI